MEQSRADQALVRPFLLASFGLVEQPIGPDSGRIANAQARRDDLQRQLTAAQQDLGPQIGAVGPFGAPALPGGVRNPALVQQLTQQLSQANSELAAAQGGGATTLRRMTEDERLAGMSATERLAHENLTLSLERERKALQGKLPISEGTRQRKTEEFRLFKESMARGGNPIVGETPESATATTTAGIQSLRQFQERFALVEDAERRGELTQGTGLVLQRLGVTSDIGAQRMGMLSGFPLGPGRVAGGFSGLLEPFEAQRALQFQAQQQAFARQQQRSAAIGMLVGGVAGFAIGGPVGAMFGAAGGAILSTERAKKDIAPATRREERRALEMVRDLKTRTYRYRWEPDTVPKRMGLIAEEAPREIVTPDGQGLDVGRTIGMLTAATRALARQAERKGAA